MKKIVVLMLCLVLLLFNISYGEYIDNGNGTITDSSTGLIWQEHGTYGSYSHDYAETYVDQLNTGGHTDWRLPTVNELIEIKDYIVDLPDFENGDTYHSNVIDSYSGNAIGVYFMNNGAMSTFIISAQILAVRDPPWHSSDPNIFNSLIDTTWEFRYSDDNEYINTVFFDNNITESSTGNYLNLLGYGDIGQPGIVMFGDFLIGDEKGYICTLQTKISSIYEIYQFNIDGNTAIGNRHLTGDFGPGTINNIKGIKIEKTIEEHFNDAPSAPARNYPLNNDEIMSTEPALSISNSIDPDGHILTYTFEIYADIGLTSLITAISDVQEGENTTSWQVDVTLNDNSFYYWRTRAYDGIEYSSWMDTAIFFVNTLNDPPTVPTISAPPDQAEVTELQPILEVNNATDIDLDPLTYEFEIYADANMNILKTAKAGIPQGPAGNTSWLVELLLEDNTSYWWRTRAWDNKDMAGAWTGLLAFFINTANDAPSAPLISSPQDGEEVATLEPHLEINNATDWDWDVVTYFFEIDKVNTFDSNSVIVSAEVLEGADNTTSWSPLQLEDNTFYYWRTKAYDGGAFSDWTIGTFFSNLFNDEPSTPTINNPGHNSTVATLTPLLVVNRSIDEDHDQIDYNFELYTDINLSFLVTAINNIENTWQIVASLEDDVQYYWRAQAIDEHGGFSQWSTPVSFWVKINNAPIVPILNNPANGGVVTTTTPGLSVNNATDPDNDILEYEFELYSDKDLSNKIISSTIPQGNEITCWTVPSPLSDHSTYYWRVRANDGQLTSGWMPTALFIVKTASGEYTVNLEISLDVSASVQETQKVKVEDDTSPIKGVSIEIPQEALEEDCTITIGVVTNPPALPSNTKAIGRVMEFGPEGITFLKPVSIMIPYTQSDLDNAGVTNPAQLEIFMYRVSTLSWEKIAIDYVDNINRLLVCEVDHFSIYTVGISLTPSQKDDESENGGGGGGGCFISIFK